MADAKVQPVSDAEFEVAFSGPAPAANRFYIVVGPGGVRIAFAEEPRPGKPSHFRSAVMLPHQDAIKLANLLKTMLATLEEQIATASDEAHG
ncbi:MAG: hypothetical protein AB7F41_17115 [Methylocystis sp.]|uniref:hypothetical protein n=1 Tax=Methylocystis sp. TaxID=1911079 RepID=UPI003D1413BC